MNMKAAVTCTCLGPSFTSVETVEQANSPWCYLDIYPSSSTVKAGGWTLAVVVVLNPRKSQRLQEKLI